MKYKFSFFRCVEKIHENIRDFMMSVHSDCIIFMCVEDSMRHNISYENILGFSCRYLTRMFTTQYTVLVQ
jgi:hypothetical protein